MTSGYSSTPLGCQSADGMHGRCSRPLAALIRGGRGEGYAREGMYQARVGRVVEVLLPCTLALDAPGPCTLGPLTAVAWHSWSCCIWIGTRDTGAIRSRQRRQPQGGNGALHE